MDNGIGGTGTPQVVKAPKVYKQSNWPKVVDKDDYMDPGYGPEMYAFGASVAKHRRKGPIAGMSKEDRAAYGQAVHDAVRAKQRQALQRVFVEHNVDCASGTNHNDGAKIHEAIRAQHRAELQNCKSRIATMKDSDVRKLYEETMTAKREAEAAEKARPTAKIIRITTAKTMKAPAPIAAPQPVKVAVSIERGTIGGAPYEIAPAVKPGHFVVRCPSPDGVKSQAAAVIQRQMKCRWHNSENGYLATPEIIERFKALAAIL